MRFLAVCLGLALGCTAKSNDRVVEVTVLPTGAVVVLTGDPIVYRDLEDPLGVLLPDGRHTSYAVAVVSASSTRLQVRTLGADDGPTCAGNFEFADDYELRFWVDKKDLRQVLVEPATFEFTDGSKLELRPGVPVIDGASGELGIPGQSLFVNLADAKLGMTHEPDRMEFEQRSELKGSTEGERLLVFDNACGRFTRRAPIDAPEDAAPQIGRNFDPDTAARIESLGLIPRFAHSPAQGAVPQAECAPVRWTIASGVAVSWADGGPAGIVRRAHQLPADAHEVGDHVCFTVDVFRLCVEASKLGRELDPDCAARD
jgi:hypothetical protein